MIQLIFTMLHVPIKERKRKPSRPLFLILITCMLGISCSGPEKETGTLPNILFILSDDIGYGDLGSYGGLLPTPNLDRLAEEGMRFTDAHSPAALCAPSRFGMLTGSYPYRSDSPGGAWNISSPSIFNDSGKYTQADRIITVGETLQKAGYRTAFFGKSHLGGDIRDSQGNLIRKQTDISTMDFSKGIRNSINEAGFDYSYFLPSGIQHEPFAFFENGVFAPFDPDKPADNSSTRLWINGRYPFVNGTSEIVEHAKRPGIGDEDYNSSQTGIMMLDKALQFIDDHQRLNRKNRTKQPFLIYFASEAIHVPHTPPVDFDGDPGVLDEQVEGITGGATGDMVYELDMQVGKLLSKIEAAGLSKNTIVFFTSDNGALWPEICDFGNPDHDNNGPFRGYKASIYEGGHRVPFIVKWPGLVSPGLVSHQLVLAQDWVATIYELTGIPMEEDQAMDCTSLMPVLTGQQPEGEALHPFVLYQEGFAYKGAIREGSLVLVVDRYNEATELYDLSTDLAQEHNLVDDVEWRGVIDRLKQKFLLYNDHDNNTRDPRTTKAYRGKVEKPEYGE
jgi:arylsulfatase A-like enzyme